MWTPASTSNLTCTGSGKIFEIPDECTWMMVVSIALVIHLKFTMFVLELDFVFQVKHVHGEAWQTIQKMMDQLVLQLVLIHPIWPMPGAIYRKNHTNCNCCYDGFIEFWSWNCCIQKNLLFSNSSCTFSFFYFNNFFF